MQHRRLGLLGSTRRIACRHVVPALLAPSCLLVGACRRARSDAALDSVSATAPQQVGNHSRFIVDSQAVLRDSAAALDARYQRERLLLDGESHALDTLNRYSAEYARRFDDWRRRARAADSLRVARDRLRARLAP